ncbi:MAG: hypothetical protein ACR2J1_07655 [Methyloceanibacter sp.]|uniref:hypothetical protein n=1 Tax=Methyloceanibacter sp. TaxID=1965321 RepID=UPI003D9BA7ED
MSFEKPPEPPATRKPSGNADYRWAEFDSEAYFQHYYGEPHPDDDLLIRHAVEAMKLAPPLGAELDIVDVGTGPNLIPFYCALPRARQLTAWEYAESNVAWLEAELRTERMRPQWRHFWCTAREAYGPGYDLPENPVALLRSRTPRRCSFAPESITERQDEFDAACAAFARSVKPGGARIAAFLVRSAGYVVADRPFPVLCLSADTIETVFSRHAENIKAARIGIVEREIRSGYSGFVFLTGSRAERRRTAFLVQCESPTHGFS